MREEEEFSVVDKGNSIPKGARARKNVVYSENWKLIGIGSFGPKGSGSGCGGVTTEGF